MSKVTDCTKCLLFDFGDIPYVMSKCRMGYKIEQGDVVDSGGGKKWITYSKECGLVRIVYKCPNEKYIKTHEVVYVELLNEKNDL